MGTEAKVKAARRMARTFGVAAARGRFPNLRPRALRRWYPVAKPVLRRIFLKNTNGPAYYAAVRERIARYGR